MSNRDTGDMFCDGDTTTIVTATGMAPPDSAQRMSVCNRLSEDLTVGGGYFLVGGKSWKQEIFFTKVIQPP